MTPEPYYSRSGITLYLGDNRDILPQLEPESISAVVTDPPAGISFMNREWDGHKGGRDAWVAWLAGVLDECNRAMKPGAHALVWALPRTSGWTHRAIEDAGLDVRDCISHWFGTGFPKSHDVSKGIDKAAGAEREVVGQNPFTAGRKYGQGHHEGYRRPWQDDPLAGAKSITAPATPEAQQWEGWHTALKPAAEFWYLARKPFKTSVAANVLAHGTGAINVDACRVGTTDNLNGGAYYPSVDGKSQNQVYGTYYKKPGEYQQPSGRWPSNVLLDEAAARDLDEMSGERPAGAWPKGDIRRAGVGNVPFGSDSYNPERRETDTGGASRFMTVLPIDDPETLRFLYTPKSSRRERNAGLEGMPERQGFDKNTSKQIAHLNPDTGVTTYTTYEPSSNQNHHPCVKSLALMRWLLTLVSPPGGVILDPFAGSGSTLVAAAQLGISAVGIEMDPEYCEIAARRIDHVLNATTQPALSMEVSD